MNNDVVLGFIKSDNELWWVNRGAAVEIKYLVREDLRT